MPVSPRPNIAESKKQDGRDFNSSSVADREGVSEVPPVLAGLIESQIIPRLLIACRTQTARANDIMRDRICASQAEGFALMVLRLEAHALMEQIEGFLARGASVEAVLVDLLAPSARQIGQWWEDDTVDFVDVTMGLWRLQQIVYELSARFPGKAPRFGSSRKALFSTFPDGDHSFGAVIVEECFRREGWQTELLTSVSEYRLVNMVTEQYYDMVGLSLSCDKELANAPALIAKLRLRSRNPRLGILVGGHMFSASPELALRIGADATGSDAEHAVKNAEILLRVLDEQLTTSS